MKSWEATRWAKKIIVCPNGELITRTEKLLLQIIADYHGENGCTASVATLAGDSLLSRRQAHRLLASLERKRVLRLQKTPGRPSHYFLNVDAPVRRPAVGAPVAQRQQATVKAARQWASQDLWLKNFLRGPGCFFIPLGTLDGDPVWWDDVSVACGGVSEEFVTASFAKMRAYISEHPDRRPETTDGWQDFVRRWLCRENEWASSQARRSA